MNFLKKFTLGFSFGVAITFGLLPDQQWQWYKENIHFPTKEFLQNLNNLYRNYNPTAVQLRKSEEIQKKSGFRYVDTVRIKEKQRFSRKRVQMLSEIRNALQNIDLVTGGTGISRQEQEKIIMTIYKKYYPEHFENYEEIIQENLKRELELDLTAKFDFLNQNK